MKAHLLILALATAAHAQTVSFESAADLAGYTTVITSNATLTQGSSYGANTSGGLRFQGNSGATDRGSVSWKALSGNPGTFGTLQASILVNVREANDTSADKGEIRLGFTASSNTLDTAKPWEFFSKHNPGISLVFKGEHKPAESKTSLLNVEMSSLTAANGTETKQGSLTLNPGTAYFEDWLKVTLTLTRTGASTFNASYTLDSLGSAGVSAPVNVFTSTTYSFTNATLAAATTAYSGFTAKSEKSKTTSLYLDDHDVSVTASAPPAPIASAATAVNSNGLTANWTAGSGVSADSYLLELSTQANNFAAGTLINASGVGGHSSGISTTGLSQIITGLSPLQTYVYRVKAVNSAGTSAASDVITTTTPNTNASPYADAIADVGPIATYAPPIGISLTGISAGGEPGQTAIITASSSNTAIIPHPTVSYTAPATTGLLTFDPTGAPGTATITVTINDGQAQNNLFTRTFTVTVSNPPVSVPFDSAGDLSAFNVSGTNITNTFSSNGGVNGGGGMISQIVTAGADSSALYLRGQTYPQPGVTQFVSSLMVNLREFDDIVSGERKGEVRLGFSPSNIVSSKPDEFFHKTNMGISVVLKGEHSTTDSTKNRKLTCELTSQDGIESKGGGLSLTNQTTAMNDWVKLTFTLTPIGSSQFLASYTLQDMGSNGTDSPVTLMSSSAVTFTNATFAAANWLYCGFAVKIDKTNTGALFFDDHSITVSTDAPSAPIATSANRITSSSFNANWTPGSGAYATGWIVEVVQGASTPFTAGNFRSITGAGGQSSGIAVSGNALRTLRISGLVANTTYRYQIKATNLNGSSTASNLISLTTLTTGTNAAPTLDAIANPAPLSINSGTQSIALSGISDGGELTQTVSISATSSNTTLIPTPTITYFSPDATGTLEFTPNAGAAGSSTITVTVSDGGANNASFSRSFAVQVVNPTPLIDFNLAADMSLLGVTNASGTTVTHQTSAGINSTGGVRLEGTAGIERVSVGIRPTAYDANSAGYLVRSMMVNFSQVLNAVSGSKDNAELRLAFTTEGTPNASNLKETLNKTIGNNTLGVVFKAEHEPLTADKFQKLEAELFSGPSDIKAGKMTLLNQASGMSHWLKVNLYAVRAGLSSFYLTYIVEDWGTTGATYLGQLLASGPHVFTNSAFASDTSVFAAFSLKGDATGTGQLFLDNDYADVNTTAPHAPIAQGESDLEHNSFTANWSPAALGPEADGWILEVSTYADNFAPGTLISASGMGGQSSGITIADPYATSFTLTGLTRQTTYLYRVRGYRGSEQGAMLNTITTITPYGPGLEFTDWRNSVFGVNASNVTIAGPSADPDQDGVPNLLEWSLGLNALASDSHLLPRPDLSGPYLRYTYRQRHSVTGYTVIPEISSTMQSTDWHPEEIVLVSISAPDANGMETVVVEDLYSKSLSTSRFIRLRVE